MNTSNHAYFHPVTCPSHALSLFSPPSVMNRTSILIRSNCLQFSHPHALVEFKFFCSYFCVKCTRWSTAESCSCRVRLPCRSLMSFSFDSNVHFSVFSSFFSKSCFTFSKLCRNDKLEEQAYCCRMIWLSPRLLFQYSYCGKRIICACNLHFCCSASFLMSFCLYSLIFSQKQKAELRYCFSNFSLNWTDRTALTRTADLCA